MFGQNVRENSTNATANLSSDDSLSEKKIKGKKIPSIVKKIVYETMSFLIEHQNHTAWSVAKFQ